MPEGSQLKAMNMMLKFVLNMICMLNILKLIDFDRNYEFHCNQTLGKDFLLP